MWEFGNFTEQQGKHKFCLEPGYVCQVSFVYVIVINQQIGTGKMCGQTGKTQGI